MNMTANDQNKLMKAGFMIIRKDDYPSPRIKVCTGSNGGWETHNTYPSKAERDRVFKQMLQDDKIIEG